MKRPRYLLQMAALVAAAWVFAPVPARAADGTEPTWLDLGPPGYYDPAVRFGWWGAETSGSKNKTGEFQSLSPAPFFDVDGLSSSGTRTLDYHGTWLDNEDADTGLYYFGPRMSADVDYERFFRRLDRNDLVQFNPDNQPGPYTPVPPTSQLSAQNPGNPLVISRTRQDVGEDYAIRVQEFRTTLKGDITDNLRWRVNLWGMRKSGDRQATAFGHCYNFTTTNTPSGNPATFSTCHQISQRQQIDWLTQEIEPVFEANFGPVTVEYSHTVRTFNQDDSIVTRNYTAGNHTGWIWPGAGQVPYAVVPENLTNIDKLKIGADLTDTDHFYAYLMNGDSKNEERLTHRYFNDIDVRLVDQTIPGVTLTGYGKQYRQTGQLPDQLYETDIIQGTNGQPPGTPDYDHPINYRKSGGGVKARWAPYEAGWACPKGLAFLSGYEYVALSREFATTEFEEPGVGEFVQPDTITNTMWLGSQMRWSASFDTFVRYTMRKIDDPLYGLRIVTTDINSALPTDEDLVQIGGTWFPTDNFLLSATIGFESRLHRSFHENTNEDYPLLVDQNGIPLLDRPLPNPREDFFTEDSYPITLSAWWAPTCKWSFTAGYATFTNWIDQLITLGDDYNDGVYNPAARNYVEADAFQSMWKHATRSHVVDVGATYHWTDRVSLLGSVEYVRGEDKTMPKAPDIAYNPLKNADGTYAFVTPDWSYITPGSDVSNETWRATAGVDYELSRRVSTFFRYNLYRFADYAGNEGNGNGGTGTAHLFLGGMTAMF